MSLEDGHESKDRGNNPKHNGAGDFWCHIDGTYRYRSMIRDQMSPSEV